MSNPTQLLYLTEIDLIEFMVLAFLAGWVIGIATHALLTGLERWMRSGELRW